MRHGDLVAAWRHLRRNPGFSVLAAGALALGLTATITTFGLVSAVMLAPLPYPSAERLWAPRLLVAAAGTAGPLEPSSFSDVDFENFRRVQTAFDRVAAYLSTRLPLSGGGGPERVGVEFVTPEYLTVLGARPEVGRLFAAGGGEAAGDARSLLLSDRLWRRRFGADPAILGRSIQIERQRFTVAGVLPAGFEGLGDETELWLPLAALPAVWDYPDVLTSRDFHSLRVVARARAGLSAGGVGGAVASAGRAVGALGGAARSATADTLAASRRDLKLRRILVLLLAAAGAVLLIASANVAGLQLSRTTARRRELAVRSALGASRRQVVTQALAESGMLALCGGVTGLAAALALLRGLVAVAPREVPSWGLSGSDLNHLLRAGISPAVVLFALAVTLVAALLAGWVPAFAASRSAPAAALGQGGASLAGARGHRRQTGRWLLILVQTAAAVGLLAAAGLLLRSLQRLLAIDPGFQGRSVLALRIESAAHHPPDQAPLFHQRLLAEAGRLPGVSEVALGSCVPFECHRTTILGSLDGRAVPAARSPVFSTQFVSPGYFRTIGIPLIAGRDFTAMDRQGAPRVVIVSQALARRLWPHESAIGHRLNSVFDMPEKEEAQVIGVAGDVRLKALASAPMGDLYVADYQNGAAWGVLFVGARGRPAGLVPALRRVVRGVDPDLPFVTAGTLGEQLARASSRSRFTTALVSAVAAVALFLTLLAVYGVVAQAVAARRRELALRVALGASRGSLLRLVVQQGLLPVLAGLVLGVPLVWAASRGLRALIEGTSGVDAAVYPAVFLLVLGAGVVASLLPARRALGVDPALALRHE